MCIEKNKDFVDTATSECRESKFYLHFTSSIDLRFATILVSYNYSLNKLQMSLVPAAEEWFARTLHFPNKYENNVRFVDKAQKKISRRLRCFVGTIRNLGCNRGGGVGVVLVKGWSSTSQKKKVSKTGPDTTVVTQISWFSAFLPLLLTTKFVGNVGKYCG